MMTTTQERLATGLKVNSALDNPLNFFTAKGLNNRATQLSALLDSMSNGIQTIQAANNGLTSITSLAQQLQSVVSQARADSTAAPVTAGAATKIGLSNTSTGGRSADLRACRRPSGERQHRCDRRAGRNGHGSQLQRSCHQCRRRQFHHHHQRQHQQRPSHQCGGGHRRKPLPTLHSRSTKPSRPPTRPTADTSGPMAQAAR